MIFDEVVPDINGLVSVFCNMVRDSLGFMRSTNRVSSKVVLIHSMSTWKLLESGWFKVIGMLLCD